MSSAVPEFQCRGILSGLYISKGNREYSSAFISPIVANEGG